MDSRCGKAHHTRLCPFFRRTPSLSCGVPMRYVIAVFAIACAIVWDFTQNQGAYTREAAESLSHFLRTTF